MQDAIADGDIVAGSNRAAVLGRLDGALAARTVAPCRLASAGSSTTAGTAATSAANRWVNGLVLRLQTAYPSDTGSESTVVASVTAQFGALTTAAGVHGYNAGEAGATSDTYLTADKIARIAALAPRAVIHMIGSNDFAAGTSPATVKANVAGKIAALKAQQAGPCVHILVHSFQRFEKTNYDHPWADYGAALAEIADADPQNVVFIDISPTFVSLGIPGNDTFGLMASDKIHLNNAGHALMADLVYRALLAGISATSLAPLPDTTAPSAPVLSPATVGDGQVALTWTAATDAGGVTGYKVRRNGAVVAPSVSGTSHVDTGLTNGTSYTWTVSALDGAGNESAVSNLVSATPVAPPNNLTRITSDSFTGGDATTVQGRSTDAALGGTTASYTVTAAGLAIASGQLVQATTAVLTALELAAIGTQDYALAVKVAARPSTGSIYLNLRSSADNNTRLRVVLNATTISVVKTVAGTGSSLTSGIAYANGDTVEARIVGTTLSVRVNGFVVYTTTVTDVPSGTKVALSTPGTAGQTFAFDDLTLDSVSA